MDKESFHGHSSFYSSLQSKGVKSIPKNYGNYGCSSTQLGDQNDCYFLHSEQSLRDNMHINDAQSDSYNVEDNYSPSSHGIDLNLGFNSFIEEDLELEEIVPETQVFETSIKENKDTVKECKEVLWPKTAVQALILNFEEVYDYLNQGSLGKKHWDKIADAINIQCGTSITGIQCKYKWNRLKRTFKKEKQLENSTGEKPSSWSFYEDMDHILGNTLKIIGLMNGYSGDEWVNTTTTPKKDIEEKLHDEDSPVIIESAAKKKENEEPHLSKNGIEGKRTKRKRVTHEPFGERMEKSLMHFTETMKEIEHAKMEQETKRMEKILDVQLQIAKLFAQNNSSDQHHERRREH